MDVGPAGGAPRKRGRPAQITLEQVASAATEIGLERLTVQAVADHLGVTRAAVYHYVEGTDELRRLAAHRLLPAFEILAEEHDSWQDWLRSYVDAGRHWRLQNAHLLVEVTVNVADLPWLLVIADEGMGRLMEAGFTAQRAGEAIQFISGLLWINTFDEVLARESPGGRHPQATAMALAEQRGEIVIEHLPLGTGAAAFSNPERRLRREIDWAITALELELARTIEASEPEAAG